MLEQVQLLAQQQSALGVAAAAKNSPDADRQESDFFCFKSDTTEHADATLKVDLHLSNNSREIDRLHKFSLVKVFKKYNTPLPSSAQDRF